MTILIPYDPAWKTACQELAQVYRDLLGDPLVGIEHVGSTAIEGITAKPILDIDLVIQDCSALPLVSQKLSTVGYQHNGDLGIPQREVFDRSDERAPWTDKERVWMEHHL